jgi:RNA polymerase sigma factor (sigma-70 family)
MNSTALHMIARLCRNLAGEGALTRAGDRELLARFTGARDQAAFAVLLDRHSRLVWAVCRGLLPDDADAEDAFQATFVALFRGAARIRHTRSLAPWLHTAATRIARKVRLAAARRRGRERRAARSEPAPAAVSDETWDALSLAVHHEIDRLPATLRLAFVLCVLEGHRHQDAAAQLGVPVGTISARVSRARDRLMAALSARGLTAVVAASALTCATATVSAGVPPAILHHIHRQLVDGFASVSDTVLHLANTVAGGTSMTGKWLGAVLITSALLAASGSVWYANAQQQAPPPAPAAGEKPAGQERRDEALPPGALFRFGPANREGTRIASAFSPDGRFVAVGEARGPLDPWVPRIGEARGRLDLWDARTGKPLRALRTKGPDVWKVGFSPDGRSLVECREDNGVQWWSVPDGDLRLSIGYDISPSALAFGADGRGVLYSGWGGYRFCDSVTGKVRWQKPYVFEAATFSADGKTLLWVSGQHLNYSDAATGEKKQSVPLKTPAPPNNGICSVMALAPDGRRLALGMQTGHVYFCDPLTGVELKRFHAADRPAKDAPERGYLTIDGVREGFVNRVAFSPDSKWLGTGGSEGDVRLWEVATGREVLRLKGHTGWVVDLAFGSNGRTLLTSSEDGQAYLWSLRPPPEEPGQRSLETLWAALAAEPAQAYRALWRLSETEGAAAFLGRKVLPAAADERLPKWVADLDDDEFAVREKAHQQLADQGRAALPVLRRSLAEQPSAEQRRRIEALVRFAETRPIRAEPPSAQELREERAIVVLEMLGTAEARRALQSLAGGAPGAPRTTASQDALKRLGQ